MTMAEVSLRYSEEPFQIPEILIMFWLEAFRKENIRMATTKYLMFIMGRLGKYIEYDSFSNEYNANLSLMSPKAQRFKICQVDVLNPLGT